MIVSVCLIFCVVQYTILGSIHEFHSDAYPPSVVSIASFITTCFYFFCFPNNLDPLFLFPFPFDTPLHWLGLWNFYFPGFHLTPVFMGENIISGSVSLPRLVKVLFRRVLEHPRLIILALLGSTPLLFIVRLFIFVFVWLVFLAGHPLLLFIKLFFERD